MEVKCVLQQCSYDELAVEDQNLLDKAHEAASNAFAPIQISEVDQR